MGHASRRIPCGEEEEGQEEVQEEEGQGLAFEGEEPHPWIRHIPCGKKVCRFVTKCDMKEVKAYERKSKKQEAAIAKKYEAMDWKRRMAWKKAAPERKKKAAAKKKAAKKG